MSKDATRDTPARLLDAARAEFARYGISGARVDRIAEQAEANKQRIYAYFGSKERLFSAVLAQAYQDLGEQVPVPTTKEGLEEYVGQVFDYHRRDNSLVRLLAWEGLHYGNAEIPGEDERQAYYRRKNEVLSKALAIDSPQEAGGLLMTLIGIASWPFVAEQQRRLMAGLTPESAEGWDQLRESLTLHGRAVINAKALAPEPDRISSP
ncbi:TetR family transcriptional regulator [Streptomyces sp. H27-C3]|uniref:TetR/AcrR family transcriptional regulator n=1 Tax=Streptomyces sp. H27-C3 TaxID=3046305 RepID=UPI0024BBAA61|nr:TetR family transcriptional regulator [Streptomyces sp. H27-C3]MDJ0465896.1 TetR family transcriptional regulator [Streptomyces sp. H27-C3]